MRGKSIKKLKQNEAHLRTANCLADKESRSRSRVVVSFYWVCHIANSAEKGKSSEYIQHKLKTMIRPVEGNNTIVYSNLHVIYHIIVEV